MPKVKATSLGRVLLLCCMTLFLSSCTSLVTTTLVEPTVDNLQKQTDLDLVCQGAPAYLLMIDSMIASDPHSVDLLQVGSQAYSGYLAAMGECGFAAARMNAIAEKARLYGTRLLAELLPIGPGVPAGKLEARLAAMRTSQVPRLFWGAMAWLSWIREQQGAPAAMADLVTVKKLMHRLLELDDTYQAGSVHLFFGAYYASRPPMLGGDPAKSRYHFEKALAISHRQFLLVQTTYAETLARQLFDQKLHDRLLHEVLDFPIGSAPDFALSNQIAKRKAKQLLDENYFAQ